jgi:hypothetical protein
LLEKQEDLLYEEHDKVVEVEKSLALEIKKNEMLAFELSSCHSSITSLKSLNDDLNTRIEKVNVASSSIEHVSICAKCKDHNFNVCSNHAYTIAKLNDEISQLNVPLKNCKNDVGKVKFARGVLPMTIGPIGRYSSLIPCLVSLHAESHRRLLTLVHHCRVDSAPPLCRFVGAPTRLPYRRRVTATRFSSLPAPP